MIRIRDIKGDFYRFDAEEFALIGERTKTKYQLGDEVEVRVKQADLVKKHLRLYIKHLKYPSKMKHIFTYFLLL